MKTGGPAETAGGQTRDKKGTWLSRQSLPTGHALCRKEPGVLRAASSAGLRLPVGGSDLGFKLHALRDGKNTG